ncbi:hypothetical protein FQN57_002016 [Myotisia sp. PD_48]|nr:hypothetical protein FQN57_002016 [Myotisia sp. PD_48]
MDVKLAVVLSIFILGVIIFLSSRDSSFAYSRPAESLSIVFLNSGVVLLLWSLITSCFPGSSSNEDQNDIPLTATRFFSGISSDPLDKLRKISTAKLRKTWTIFGLTIVALALRVELHQILVKNSNCSVIDNTTVYIPLVVALYDYQDARRSSSGSNARTPDPNQRNHFSSILPPALLIVVGILSQLLKNGWESTTICPVHTKSSHLVLGLQILVIVVDSIIVISAGKLATSSFRGAGGKAVWQTTTIWGILLVGGAVVWLLVSAATHILPFGNEGFPLPPMAPPYIGDVAKLCITVSIILKTAAMAIQQVRILSLTFLFAFLAVYSSIMVNILIVMRPYPSHSTFLALLSTTILHAAGYLYIKPSTLPDLDTPRPSILTRLLRWTFILSCGASLIMISVQETGTNPHPISILMSNAKRNQGLWIAQAGHSTNLSEAVSNYRTRYNQLPPPGFDAWYEYARNKSSIIIDDYDQIYKDLLPFRAQAPKILRELTTSMSSNQWNDIAAVIIRDGVAKPQEGILPTHSWMIKGIADMITPFAHHLPDMDIGFNINDECRVSVPWDTIQSLKRSAKSHPAPSDQISPSWSSNRAQSWAFNGANDKNTHIHFVDMSYQSIFHTIGSRTCPPNSKARTQYKWERNKICISCAKPHSLGQFLKDWELSGNACHQPDLSHMHGFYLSPAAFKVSDRLLPVFSQSKVSGFNDILYPSAWNYLDKVKYEPSQKHPDPPYAQKESTMIWRGATSEGKSEQGTWKGMARQRVVHLANNHTSHVSVLLPSGKQGSFSYQTLSPSEISRSLGLNTSISLAQEIVRCGSGECEVQKNEFGLAPRIDFQDHWKYRFLLDLDGAGFSGRFLPFLQSNSLPFRTALFRQWFESRLTPWYHYVPLDLRLHDMWSTLAYFAGAKTMGPDGKTKKMVMESHSREGELIAEEGRKWAEKVLRKEDMEVYFFRLLLEWGRLTDDRRDQLGFQL